VLEIGLTEREGYTPVLPLTSSVTLRLVTAYVALPLLGAR
jgi:hypothetical protein